MLQALALSAQLLASDASSGSFADLRADFDTLRQRPEYASYIQGFGRSKGFPATDTLAACGRLAIEEITVLIELGADGHVRRAVADRDTAGADCYVAAFSGAQFAPPQFAPFVMSVVFRKEAR